MARHVVVGWFVAKQKQENGSLPIFSLVMSVKMISRRFASVFDAIWESGVVATVMTTYFYRRIFETVCWTTRRSN